MSEQTKVEWPEHLWPLAEVTDWITSTSRGISNFSGPTDLYNVKKWGATASFLLNDEEVVFKGCKLPLFEKRVQTERLLAEHTPELVPDLLGAKTFQNGETWTLHRSFSGPDIETTGKVPQILEMARTLAQLQIKVARLPSSETSQLPQTPVAQIPNMLDAMIQRIEELYLDAWRADAEWYQDEFGLPSNVLEQIKHFRPQVRQWTDELIAGDWPLSIDHLDFNISNAALNENGRVLIFDWEEATMSCPFFSIDRLLQDADDFEEVPESVPRTEGPLRLSKNQMAVRNAYLDAFQSIASWKSRPERERAFDIAMCLAPIKAAYECEPFNEALGRKNGLPPHAAHCFGNALHYWQGMARHNYGIEEK